MIRHHRALLIASAFCLALGLGRLRAEDHPASTPDPQTEITRLRAENEALRAQVEQEKEKLRHFQNTIAANQIRGPIPAVRAERVIVVDPTSGDVLCEKNADVRGPVASTQKLLTALIVLESGNMEQYVTVQQSDTDCEPVRIGLKPDETYPRNMLLTALMVKSSNDIAQCLARDNAGSIEAFVDKMNERARQLGMTNSHFVNPHGLPVDDQYSTARDMARVAMADYARPDLREIVDTKRFYFMRPDGKELRLDNTNQVLHSNPRCNGMKTGYTQLSGHCLICSGELNGRQRIVVVLNDDTRNVWKDANALLEWALRG